MIPHHDGYAVRDDELHIVRVLSLGYRECIDSCMQQNTQSGTQWDGLRHFGILEHEVFYNKYAMHW